MALLDASDPIVLLSDQFLDLLDDKDNATSIAACASTLAVLLEYQWSASRLPVPAELVALREQLMGLVVSAVRAREMKAQRES